LIAYKNFEATNHAMIPGIKGQSELTKIPSNETGEQRIGSPKKKDIETVVKANTEKL
jgi:hypothetical protein